MRKLAVISLMATFFSTGMALASLRPFDHKIGTTIQPSTIDRTENKNTKPTSFNMNKLTSFWGNIESVENTYSAMRKTFTEEKLRTRGAKEVAVYSSSAPSVVMIISDESSGSGTLIDSSGNILTNWHVIQGKEYVDIIFKPKDIGADALLAPSFKAKVIKFDEVSDLALLKLLKPENLPAPIKFATSGPLSIGSNSHAIGHPLGFSWTYTRGIVSQYRTDQSWQYDLGFQHLADVVQTQTPINPGNSGGPLLNDSGEIIGVNSYRSAGDGINFAVSVSTIKEFMKRKENRYSPRIPGSDAMKAMVGNCEAKLIEQYYSKEHKADINLIDLTCDGSVNASISIPDNSEDPISFYFDTTGNGEVDVTLVDYNRDNEWDISFYDVTGDGNADIVGYHSEDDLPYEFVSYARFQFQLKN